MTYSVADRKESPASVRRPCEAAPGGEPDAASYLAAAGMGIQEELCPFGAFVEEFPIAPEAESIARELGLWTRWEDPATGEYLRDWSAPGHWGRCREDDEGAGPDLNEMHRRGLLPTPYGCPVFGHDCPRYYGFETSPYR